MCHPLRAVAACLIGLTAAPARAAWSTATITTFAANSRASSLAISPTGDPFVAFQFNGASELRRSTSRCPTATPRGANLPSPSLPTARDTSRSKKEHRSTYRSAAPIGSSRFRREPQGHGELRPSSTIRSSSPERTPRCRWSEERCGSPIETRRMWIFVSRSPPTARRGPWSGSRERTRQGGSPLSESRSRGRRGSRISTERRAPCWPRQARSARQALRSYAPMSQPGPCGRFTPR